MMEKGQAFSVFQLLISAIVAFAILYILLTIIPTGGFVGRDPTSVAKELIGDRLKYPSSPKTSDVIRFTNGSNIAPRAITEGTGITKDQVCIHMGDFAEEGSGFEFMGETGILQYTGSAIDARITVVCDKYDMVKDVVSGLGFDLTGNYVKCGSSCEEGSKRTCCVVIVRYK